MKRDLCSVLSITWLLAGIPAGAGCDVVKNLTGGEKEDKPDKKTSPEALLEEATKPKEGDACTTEKSALCNDTSSLLECTGGKWQLRSCRGKEGCKGTVVVQCDESIAKVGDNCGGEENFSCTEDGKAQVKCVAGKWQESAQCRGPKACETKFPFSKCDQSIAKEGDACGKDGSAACTEDSKAVLECKGGKYASKQACPKGCVAEGIFVKCN